MEKQEKFHQIFFLSEKYDNWIPPARLFIECPREIMASLPFQKKGLFFLPSKVMPREVM